MQLYGRIDLHSNSHHLGIIDENQKRIFPKKLANRKEMILSALMSYREQIEGVMVESTYNWYWLVDELMGAGYRVCCPTIERYLSDFYSPL